MVRISGLTFYRQDCDVLDGIKKEFPNQSLSFIKKELSNRWKALSRMGKAKYLDKAKQAKQENEIPINDLEYEDVPPPIQPQPQEQEQLQLQEQEQEQLQEQEQDQDERECIRPCIYLDREEKLEKKIEDLQEDIQQLRDLLQAI